MVYSIYARGYHRNVDTCFADGVHSVRLSSGFVANNSALITVYRLAVRNLLSRISCSGKTQTGKNI